MPKKHYGPTSAQLAEIFRRFDRPKSARERACRRLNTDLARAIGAREIAAMVGEGAEYAPIVLEPDSGPGKRLAQCIDAATGEKSFAGYEQGRAMGSAWSRIVEMGCHTEANPRAIGKYQTPETALATSPDGILRAKYRNQGGDPLADHLGSRKRTKARQYREQRATLKREIMSAVMPSELSRVDNLATLTEANETTTGDYRRYFRT